MDRDGGRIQEWEKKGKSGERGKAVMGRRKGSEKKGEATWVGR